MAMAGELCLLGVRVSDLVPPSLLQYCDDVHWHNIYMTVQQSNAKFCYCDAHNAALGQRKTDSAVSFELPQLYTDYIAMII
eukprot:COSAG06_NODE_64562_length_259_cov_0.650000_1_plen_81_part_10